MPVFSATLWSDVIIYHFIVTNARLQFPSKYTRILKQRFVASACKHLIY